MNYKTAIATAVLALGSATASAVVTIPVPVQTTFNDVVLADINLFGPSNLTGFTTFVDSYNMLGNTYPLPTVTFSSVSLYFNSALASTQVGSAFNFANLGAGSYSLRTSGIVNPAPGTANIAYVAAQLQITPVPEPETFAMLLAGLGVMGAIARRRKTAAAV